MSSLVDTMVGEYRVLRLLGQGGMGEVYEATHPIIGKRVAVKVLKKELIEDSSLALRFIEEARAVNGIRHHSIVDVFGFGTLPNGQLYLVMDLLEGESFSAYLKANAPLEPQEAMRWLIELLDAIAAAHEAGVVHRDLKPSNLFLVGPRGKRTLKVLDFGIARRLKRDERLTHPNMLLGSPSYVSPEQIRGEAHFQSDLYAIGCMAWAMLAGRTLFKGEVLDVLNQHLFEIPVAPSSLVPGIAPELDAFVLKLLAKDPKDRPASASLARDELRVIAHTAKSSPTQLDYRALGGPEESRELATPVRAEVSLTAEPPAETKPHRQEHTVVERRSATETAPSLQRPASTTDTAPALHESQHPTATAPLVAPPRRLLPWVVGGGVLVLLVLIISLSPVGERGAATPAPPVARPAPVVVTPPPPAPDPVPAPVPVPEPVPITPRPIAKTTPPHKPEPTAKPRPTPPPVEELPSRDRPAPAPLWSTLDARLKRDEALLKAGAVKGGLNAAEFLTDARTRLSASPSAAERVALETFLDDWERRYVPKYPAGPPPH